VTVGEDGIRVDPTRWTGSPQSLCRQRSAQFSEGAPEPGQRVFDVHNVRDCGSGGLLSLSVPNMGSRRRFLQKIP
jgi:hypothetical protein